MWRIAVKRCRLSLRNGWFLSAWAVGAVLAASTVWVSWFDHHERVRLFDASRVAHDREVEQAQVYAQFEGSLERRPTPLSLLSRGVGERLGSSAAFPGRFGQTRVSRRDRPLVQAARRLNVDLSWVLALTVGFTSIFFAHGVINGEREAGTMKQQLAKGVSRRSLLFGEFLGGVLMVVLPCSLLLLGFLLWTMVGGPTLDGSEGVRAGLFFLLVALYGCFWIALALASSVVCRQPSTSLVLGVLVWVLSAALYPQAAGWAAARMAPSVPVRFAVDPVQETVPAWEDLEDDRGRRLERRNALSREYRHYRWLAALLPVTAFLDAGQALAGTSAADHEQFLRAVDRAERSFESWQAEKLAKYPERDYTFTYGAPPLDIRGLPKSAFSPVAVRRSLSQASLPAGALVFGAAALLSVALAGLEKLDAR